MARPHRFRMYNLKFVMGFADNQPSKSRSILLSLTYRLILSTASAISKKNFDPQSSNMAKCKLATPLNSQTSVCITILNNALSISTAQKMIRACNTLSVPVYATTQNASRLGPICSELNDPPLYTIDKTAFSMLVPELRYTLAERSQMPYQIAIVGIETHICVTQTALDLLSEGHRVYVLTDGVSSCNGGERGVALSRLR
ncbi:MAG: hypothetical protein Q9161_000878 [Pseudevernia consocians]